MKNKPIFVPTNTKFFDVLKPNPALNSLIESGILVKSTSKYTVFEYFGPFADLNGLACRVQQPLFNTEPYIVTIPTTYLLKHFFKWK